MEGGVGPTFFFSAAENSKSMVTLTTSNNRLTDMGVKRGREGRGPADKSKKKLKVQSKSSGAANSTPAPPQVFGVDDLDWKSVQLPDRIDDLGGFFGLEEIDGVDIVRQNTPGEIKFKVVIVRTLEQPPSLRLTISCKGCCEQTNEIDIEENSHSRRK